MAISNNTPLPVETLVHQAQFVDPTYIGGLLVGCESETESTIIKAINDLWHLNEVSEEKYDSVMSFIQGLPLSINSREQSLVTWLDSVLETTYCNPLHLHA